MRAPASSDGSAHFPEVEMIAKDGTVVPLVNWMAMKNYVLWESATRFLRGFGTRTQRRNDAMVVYRSLTPEQKRRLD